MELAIFLHRVLFLLSVFHLLTYSTINASCNGGSSDVSESIYCSSTLLLSTDFDDPSESLILMQPSSTVPVESESVNIPTSSSGLLASMDITSTLVTEIASGSQTLELGSSQTSSLLYGPTMTSSFLLMETTFLSSAQSSSYFSSPPLSSSSNILMSSVLPSSLVQSLSQSILSTQSLSLSSSDILATPTPSPSLSSPPLVVSSSERVLETLSTTAHYMVSSSLFVTISTRPPTNSLVSSFSALFTQISTSSITPTPATSSAPISSPLTPPPSVQSSSPTPSQTGTSPTSGTDNGLLDQIWDFFQENRNVSIIVFVGGFIISFLICMIMVVICCCCCCRRKKDRYSVDERRLSNGNVRGTRYRPSISSPQHFYHQHEMHQQHQSRPEPIDTHKRREVFAETEIGEVSIDDALHYQGHSQVQHSQLLGGGGGGGGGGEVTQQSLSKLTPFDPSQMILQVGGGISVDDDDEVSPVTKEAEERDGVTDGRDSPFMHLSDNLSQSRNRRSNEHSQDVVGGENSQYSYLGLGVMHGSDVMFTGSMMDESQDPVHRNPISAVGMGRGISNEPREETLDRASHRTDSPLLSSSTDELLDDTPTKVSKGRSSSYAPGASRDIALLTSLEKVRDGGKTERSLAASTEEGRTKRTSLSSLTSLPRPQNPKAAPSPSADSDLQETPEKIRSNTVSVPSGSFSRATGGKSSSSSRLGKLTSLEYIRASLRMKLKRMKVAKDNDSSPENPKKPLKSALRKTGSVSSYDSSIGASNTYTNHYASDFDESPHHIPAAGPVMSPRHPFPPPGDFMGPHPPYGMDPMLPYDPMGPGYHHPPPHQPAPFIDGYSYPISPHLPPGNYPPPMHGGMMYGTDQLSPILSVSQMDYHPTMHVGLLPQYGHPGTMGMRGAGGGYDNYFPSQPPNYDDDEDDDIPYRHNDMNANASQRSVRWKLEDEEIPPRTPVDPEQLTPSDDEGHHDR